MNTLSEIVVTRGGGAGGLLHGLIYLVIVALCFWLCWWFIDYVGIPEPFNKVIRVVLGLFALIILINFLLSLIGNGFIAW